MAALAPLDESSIDVFTAEERPELWEQARTLFEGVWPEYNNHGNHTGKYFGALVPRHARFQVLLYDTNMDCIVARGGNDPLPMGRFVRRPSYRNRRRRATRH